MYQASLAAAEQEAEAAASGTDEEGAEPVTADSLTFLGNPMDFNDDDPHAEAKKKPKKKRGGQRKNGRARAKPLYFEPSLFQDERLLEEFKQRVRFTNHDFLTFFRDKDLQVCHCLS